MDKIICAGVITYNPDIDRLKENIAGIYQQDVPMFVIDNGSNNIEGIEEVCKPLALEIIRLNENRGIATALNILMKTAQKNGFKWVLSMDQDTRCDEHLIEEYRKYLELDGLGALCPSIRKVNEEQKEKATKEIELVHRCPTSGFLCSVQAFQKTEGYNEWMFIDYVDYDLCMKLELAGYNIYRVNTTYILQELGKVNKSSVFYRIGKALGIKKLMNFSTTYNHSPFRNYYYVRNSLYYCHIYKRLIVSSAELNKIVKWELKKLLLERQKVEQLRALIRGIKDYKEAINK